jgi:hypothetical protein
MYSYARRGLSESLIKPQPPKSPKASSAENLPESVLFLQVYAAADYFTLDQSLMENVPPVDLDIILDPYLLNVLPKSLLPTAGYLCVLAVCSWFLAGVVWKVLLSVAGSSEVEKKEEGNKYGEMKKNE